MMNLGNESANSTAKLWTQVQKDYQLHEVLGEGSFGQVYKATSLKTGQEVAIKLITGVQETSYYSRKVLREIIILRKLSEIEENIFTTKLIDIILPEGVICQRSGDGVKISNEEESPSPINYNKDGQKTSPTMNL